MIIHKNSSLKKLNTFGLDCKAEKLIIIHTEEDAAALFKDRNKLSPPVFIIGGGSNLLFLSDYKGTLIQSAISEITIEERHSDYVIISVGSGIHWDELVEWSVNSGLGGLENLSLIPGNVGASPVQNIGAYGVEVKDCIEKVRAISITDGKLHEFRNHECGFDYRNSVFKGTLKGKYLITRVFYRLSTDPKLKLDYGSLTDEITKIGEPNLANVRQTVINIRKSKLPDPEIIGNAGSFFKNPVVRNQIADKLITAYPQMPVYNDKPGTKKLAAAWLIDKCGWKGIKRGDAGVHDKQALVLVNHGKASGRDIFRLSEEIRESVQEKFGIELEREVELIGTI